jgi:hypothetical protein
MGWYGTLVIARPTAATLAAQPQVRQAFGSYPMVPDRWNARSGQYALNDLGQGWQWLGVGAFYSERLRVAQGVADLVAATGAPALAAHVSESSCAHLAGRAPSGAGFCLHLPNVDQPCGYEHLDGQPPAVDRDVAVDALLAWAREAGRRPVAEVVETMLHPSWRRQEVMDDVVLALFAALGFTSTGLVQPLFNTDEPAFDDLERLALRGDHKASAQWRAAAKGRMLDDTWELTEREADYLELSRLVHSSVYGGATREELVERFQLLRARWGD